MPLNKTQCQITDKSRELTQEWAWSVEERICFQIKKEKKREKKKTKEYKISDLPDSNQRPKDACEFPTTVLRSTN